MSVVVKHGGGKLLRHMIHMVLKKQKECPRNVDVASCLFPGPSTIDFLPREICPYPQKGIFSGSGGVVAEIKNLQEDFWKEVPQLWGSQWECFSECTCANVHAYDANLAAVVQLSGAKMFP